jgi:hypothetical protein
MILRLVPSARNTDPATSHEAAASVTDLRRSQNDVLRALEACVDEKGATDTELVSTYVAMAKYKMVRSQSESGIRTRRKELVTLGKVADSGYTETLPSGRKSIIWKLTDE